MTGARSFGLYSSKLVLCPAIPFGVIFYGACVFTSININGAKPSKFETSFWFLIKKFFKEVGEREFDRRWENNESSRDSLVQQKYRAKKETEKATPKDERLLRVRERIYVDEFVMVSRREDKEALKFLCNSSPSSPDGASSSQPGFLKKV